MAEQLDTASPQGQVVTTPIALKFAQAAPVAQALSQAFAAPPQQGGPRGATANADDRVTIVAEPMSNYLLVTASAKNLDRIKSLLEKLDTEQAGGMKTELLVLAKGKAADMAPTLTRMVGAWTTTPAGRAGSQPGVVVSADIGIELPGRHRAAGGRREGPEDGQATRRRHGGRDRVEHFHHRPEEQRCHADGPDGP